MKITSEGEDMAGTELPWQGTPLNLNRAYRPRKLTAPDQSGSGLRVPIYPASATSPRPREWSRGNTRTRWRWRRWLRRYRNRWLFDSHDRSCDRTCQHKESENDEEYQKNFACHVCSPSEDLGASLLPRGRSVSTVCMQLQREERSRSAHRLRVSLIPSNALPMICHSPVCHDSSH